MISTISSTNNTMADNERFGLDLNLTINSDMGTIVRAMAEPASDLDTPDRKWLKTPIPESFLDVFLLHNEHYEEDEAKYEVIPERILDETQTNLAILRQKIYSKIQTHIPAEECAHKLLRMNLHREQEMEFCQMILNICAQRPTYECFFGLLGRQLCILKKEYVEYFEKLFKDQYEIVHSLENVQLRNVANFFAYLLRTNAISWGVCIHFEYQINVETSDLNPSVMCTEEK